jgi:general secretion pathway protein G
LDVKIVKGVVVLLEWLEKNYKIAVGGLVVVVLLLAAAFVSSRSTASKEIVELNETKASLEAAVANSGRELDEARARVAELEKSGEASKAEITALTESSKKLGGRIAALSDTLASADKKIVSLQDSVDIRRKAMANMREDIAALKEEVREFLKEIAALEEAKKSLETAALSNERELGEARARVKELEKISPPRVEDALPASPKALGTIMLKLSGLEPFGTMISELKKVVPAISDIAKDKEIVDELVSSLAVYEDFTGTVRDVAVLLELDQRPEIYVSFLADAVKFGEFVSRDSSLYSFEPWYKKGVGYYVLRPAGDDAGDEMWFYAAAGPAGTDRTSSLVFMTTSEGAISRMVDAYDGVSPRFETDRHTSGENFFQVKLRDGLTYRDVAHAIWNIQALADLWDNTPDKVLWSVVEESWTKDGDDIIGETYCDIFERNPEIVSSRPENALKRDIYGDGSLAYYVSLDFGLLLNMILPGATSLTPEILALVDTYTPFPLISKDDIKDLFKGGRLSFVCVEKDGRVSTAYAALETNVPSAANALYRLGEMLFAMSSGSKAKIAGWDTAMSAPIPLPLGDSQPAPSLVIAEKRGVFLVGLGEAEDFGKTLGVSSEGFDYVNTENVGELFISPKLFDAAISYINFFYFMEAETSSPTPEDERIKDLLISSVAGVRDSFVSMGGGLRPSGRGYVKLSLPEGKDPIRSLFADVFVPWIELAAAEQNASTDGAKAAGIITDLRNLKAAALMYYADNAAWPAQSDVWKLDEYMGSPLVSGDRYKRVIIGGEYDDGSGGKKVNIGVELSPGDSDTPGIRKELADRAGDTGLFESAGSSDRYSGSSSQVYMNMR